MIVIPPIPITTSNLVSSTVPEPSAGETAWNSATSYTVGQVVIRTTTHRKYECQIAGVEITDEFRALYKEWGNPNTGEIIDGKLSTGYLIRNCGKYFEVYNNEVNGKFLKRTRYGFKIGNALKGDVVYFRKAMPVAIGISYKRNKNAE